ncbi:ABC transporter ATP-binding protein [Arachnia propionica]|uniref:Multidrug export ATP-binding/permease protein SAV1866 n=1 Tax=Arachnia propionica TaxID=1750 RepID=A0A3S4UGV6_9ACTN|nr:ABC transporter ATP-binding protein [Arachnia propionica]VEH71338.1 Putative multidrug export ATP-binding/permease protein SAV1866 [Arachnia propionica]
MIARLNRLIFTHLKPYWRELLAILVLQVLATAMSLYLPNLNAQIIDDGVVKGDTDLIWRSGALMLLFSLVQAAGQIGATWFGALTAMSLGRDLRAAIFDRALSFSTREMRDFGASSLLTRNTNDVLQVQTIVQTTLTIIVGAPIMMVGGFVMAVREDFGLSWIIAVSVAVLGVAVSLLVIFVSPLFQRMQTNLDNLNRVLREQISGIRVIRAFIREDHESRRFEGANEDVYSVTLRASRWMVLLFPIAMFMVNISSVAVIWFGAFRIDSGNIQIGQMAAFLNYLIQILISVMMSTMLLFLAPRSAVSADRILEVLDTEPTVAPPADPVAPQELTGVVEFRDVTFTYPGAEDPVLANVSFTLAPGRTTAIIGSTGSGKSTLVNLIPRLYDVSSGEVLVDGVDVRRLDPDALWSRIGLVPQKPYLFSGTVASNLLYGRPDATPEQMWEALRIAQAADFVEKLDGGLAAHIAQGGTNVSGGQRQRLSIARALVKEPAVYVFDDSFSALDVATDARLRAALAPATADRATLIVAQRVATIRGADEILVLEHGRIVGRGTHDELLASNATYQEIVDSQLSAEEAQV